MAAESNSGNNSQMPQISEYKIVGMIAKGAMGEVYKALDPILNREVAIKVLAPALISDDDATSRFQREAKATAKIRHKNVAIIYSVGKTADDIPYMAMEYIDGLPLSDLILNKTEFIYSQVVDIMLQCCQGLEAAKREGIIHRDIKPSNIMILPNGEVKLVDFGLAKIFRDESFLTVDNMVMGTPAYMSPEQSLGHKSIDFRSDIYSLGASFYHMLAGELPFEAESPVQLMMKHANSPLRSINVINPKVPHDLSDIIHRMMSKDREARYQDYEELIIDLKKTKVTCMAKERNQGLKAPPLMTAVAGVEAGADAGEPMDVDLNKRQFSSLDDLSGGDNTDDGAFSDLHQTYRIPAAASQSDFEQEIEASLPGSPYQIGRHHEPGRINRRILEAAPAKPVGKPMLWWQKSLVVLLIVIVGFAILASVIKPPPSPNEDSSNRKSLLALFLQSLAGGEKEDPADTPEMILLREYNETKSRIEDLQVALQQYEARQGVLPNSLRAMTTNGSVPSDHLLDVWGQRFNYVKIDRRITSNGPDGRENTSDDIFLKLDGSNIIMPARYGQLIITVKEQEEERAQHKSKDDV